MWTVEQNFMTKILQPTESGKLEERREEWRRQREGKKEGERLRGGTEGRGRKAERKGGRGKEMKESEEGGDTFVPCFYLNVLIYHKVCPMDAFPLFSGWGPAAK